MLCMPRLNRLGAAPTADVTGPHADLYCPTHPSLILQHVLPMIPGGGSFKDIITKGERSKCSLSGPPGTLHPTPPWRFAHRPAVHVDGPFLLTALPPHCPTSPSRPGDGTDVYSV